MGQKRGFGNADSSSDDDLKLSDGESSPVFSRLKRKKRSSGRERSATPSASGHGIEHQEERKNTEESDVICIPDSLDEDEEDDSKEIAESPLPKKNTVQSHEEEMYIEDKPEHEDNHTDNEIKDDNDDGALVSDDDNGSQESDDEDSAKAAEPKARRPPNANASSFDESESESEPSEDDGDVYKSDDDSPPESDNESDFAPSPVKSARKPRAQGKAIGRQTVTNVKRPTSSLARKPLRSVAKAVSTQPSKKKGIRSLGSGAGAKRLGARIPSKLSALGKASGSTTSRPRPSTSGKGPGTVYRAGLSRNVSIPRLHSYLHKP